MAKKLIKNYVFSPGKGLSDNLRPNAYSLILQNKIFLQKEINAFLNNQILDAVKCERDLGYILDGSVFDVALGTNYNAVFLGLAEFNSQEISGTVIRTILRAAEAVSNLPAVAASATAQLRSNQFFLEVTDIAQNGRSAADSLVFPDPTNATAGRIAAKNRLISNRNFLAAEVNAWVAENYPDADHDPDKCSRDIKYAVDALTYDILYGGNSATIDQARFFFYGFADGSPGIDPTHRLQTAAAYDRLQTIVQQVVLGQTVTRSNGGTYSETQDFSGSNATTTESNILSTLVQITEDVVNQTSKSNAEAYLATLTKTTPSYSWATSPIQAAANEINSNKGAIITSVNSFLNYTFNAAKCERDSEYVIDALLFDLRYGGNEETRRISSFYWVGEVPQVDGDRIPEQEAYLFLIDLINQYILTNTLDPRPEQTIAVQVIDNTKTAEASTTTRVTQLLTEVATVIVNGLNFLPALIVGLGRVEVLGKIELEDILIVTNVTQNIVIYNFAEPTKGGRVNFRSGNSESYPQAEAVSNGTTVINFNLDTSQMLSADSIQVFLEESELRVRLNDIATDAMERMKVGIPQAMIDADFEYGLQPTKWQALSFQRGYPSTYEIPASDISVISVVTDASAGTAGIGASLITVTTQFSHGLVSGTPITIRALSASVLGFNRAEGTFIVVDTPTLNTFTYFAKSKVGTTDGEVLAIANTQLRKADFYTGAAVPGATFSVFTNGSSGNFDTALQSRSGTSTLTFIGTRPPIGAPLVGPNISAGTQVTAVFGPDNIDGIIATRFVGSNANAGDTTISLTDVSGISAGMAISDGDPGNPEQRVITSVVGNTLTLNGQLSANYLGDQTVTAGVVLSSFNYIVGDGEGATFNVTITDNIYSVTVNSGGLGYNVGDTLVIFGFNLGGGFPENLRLNVTSVGVSGQVTGVQIIDGTENNGIGSATFTNVESDQTTNTSATNAIVTVSKNAGVYFVTLTNGGTGFNIGNRFLLPGSNFGGESITNDITITVTGVSNTVVQTLSFTGTAARGDQIDIFATISLSQPTTGVIPAFTDISYSSISTLQVDFDSPHGLVPGSTILVTISSTGSNHQLAAGPYFVNEIVNLNRIRYIARTAGNIQTNIALEGEIYVRPDTYFSHRPFDGGVQLSTGGPQHGAQAVRMSKKYIRYQSGKGAMYNTGALFAPSFDLSSITADSTEPGSFISVTTDDVDHGLQAGSTVIISGTETVGYDGEYIVNEILDERSFTVVAQTQLGSTEAVIGPLCQVALYKWQGSVVRSGCFDDQNGIFWQYDGQIMAVGRRTSTFQVAGTISITSGSSTVNGLGTRFLNQLQEGDRIVIKGMTHVITNIVDNQTLYVSPGFRGVVDVQGAKISKVEDIIIPQTDWNLDRCDGTGPSGYDIDVTKMQMIGIQFTWYGAGFTDWMLRGPDGNYVFCHRLKGNNLNTEAYMRTGNLPVRYEVLNESARSRLVGNINATQTSIPLKSVRDFPNSGVVYIDNELISYTGRNLFDNLLTGCSRGVSLNNFSAGSNRTYLAGPATTHSDRQGVILISTTTSPIISHWGSAYLIDGQFDEDRGYIFSYSATNVRLTGIKTSAFALRLAPSVSNAVVGDLGERELLNRAQLLLSAISVTAPNVTNSGPIIVEGIINPSNYPTNPDDINWIPLNSPSQGGQPSFAQVASGGSITWQGSDPGEEVNVALRGIIQSTFTAQDPYGLDNSVGLRAVDITRNYIWMSIADFNRVRPIVGDVLSGGGVGTRTITSITDERISSVDYKRITFSGNANSNNNNAVTVTITFAGSTNTYNRLSYLIFTNANWVASGVTVGDLIAFDSTVFAPNTSVTSVIDRTFDNTTYVRVNLNQSSSGSISIPTDIKFLKGFVPGFGSPGEQVFSFICSPGETATLDLSELKELTTTAIGGRGTFPNGPDVLAINIFTTGAEVNASVVLRWGEAQA